MQSLETISQCYKFSAPLADEFSILLTFFAQQYDSFDDSTQSECKFSDQKIIFLIWVYQECVRHIVPQCLSFETKQIFEACGNSYFGLICFPAEKIENSSFNEAENL